MTKRHLVWLIFPAVLDLVYGGMDKMDRNVKDDDFYGIGIVKTSDVIGDRIDDSLNMGYDTILPYRNSNGGTPAIRRNRARVLTGRAAADNGNRPVELSYDDFNYGYDTPEATSHDVSRRNDAGDMHNGSYDGESYDDADDDSDYGLMSGASVHPRTGTSNKLLKSDFYNVYLDDGYDVHGNQGYDRTLASWT